MPISTPATVGRVRATYYFIKSQRPHYSAETLCGRAAQKVGYSPLGK